MRIREIGTNDRQEWLRLALALWPDHEADEMQAILDTIYRSPKQTGFMVYDPQGTAIGFMNLSLRSDYVPGATQTPVAYVEGLYVEPAYQRQGIGRMMIERAEQWAREQGCSELASDVVVGNTMSEAFHKKAGFEEVDQVISFIKTIHASTDNH